MIASRFDISRFGAEVMRGSPRQSDLHDHRRPRVEQNGPCDPPPATSRCPNRPVGDLDGRLRHLHRRIFELRAGAGSELQVIPVDVYLPGCPAGSPND